MISLFSAAIRKKRKVEKNKVVRFIFLQKACIKIVDNLDYVGSRKFWTFEIILQPWQVHQQ